MKFCLDVGDLAVERFGAKCLVGNIKIGDFSEEIFCPIHFWRREDYLVSWWRSLALALSGETERCVFFVKAMPLSEANFLECWVGYFEGDICYVQNCMLFKHDWSGCSSYDCVAARVGEREEVNDEGRPISQWVISRLDMNNFLNYMKNKYQDFLPIV